MNKTELYQHLQSEEQQKLQTTAGRFITLARQVADGDEVDPDEVSLILADAGKSCNDLMDVVDYLEKLRDDGAALAEGEADFARRHPANQAAQAALQAEIRETNEAFRVRAAALENEESALRGLSSNLHGMRERLRRLKAEGRAQLGLPEAVTA